jgi:hypothetical protein
MTDLTAVGVWRNRMIADAGNYRNRHLLATAASPVSSSSRRQVTAGLLGLPNLPKIEHEAGKHRVGRD